MATKAPWTCCRKHLLGVSRALFPSLFLHSLVLFHMQSLWVCINWDTSMWLKIRLGFIQNTTTLPTICMALQNQNLTLLISVLQGSHCFTREMLEKTDSSGDYHSHTKCLQELICFTLPGRVSWCTKAMLLQKQLHALIHRWAAVIPYETPTENTVYSNNTEDLIFAPLC